MKIRPAVLGITLLLGLLPGCGEPTQPPVRVGLLLWPAYELPYLARHLGYYDGLDIQLVEYQSPAEVIHAYRSGTLDAIGLTLDYLIQMAAADRSHRAIMVINVSDGADAILARPAVTSLADLRGRRVGVERSVLGAYMLNRALDRTVLSEDDLEIVPVDVPATPAAYRDDRIDAVVTYEPYRTRIRDMGAAQLFSSADIPGEIVDVLITRSDTIEDRSRTLGRFIDGWMRAVEHFREHPRADAAVMAERESLDADQYLETLEGIRLGDASYNREMLDAESPMLEIALARTAGFMRAKGYIEQAPRIDSILDGRFFPPTDH